MKLAKIHKLESAVSKDETRAAIMQPYIQGGRAIATDGKILASVPIKTEEGEEVEGKRIPLDALKAARKATLKLIPDCHLQLGDKLCTLNNGASYPVLYPDVAWLPKVSEIVSCKLTPEDAHFSVTLDVSLLERLSQALGSEKVRLCFKDPKAPITVLPADPNNVDNAAFGLLMPIHPAK